MIDAESLKWWSSYAAAHSFNTQEEAHAWVARKIMLGDKTMVRDLKSPEEYSALALEVPLYQSGSKWKIGKKIRTDHRLRMSDIEIRRPSKSDLHQIGSANFYRYELGETFLANINEMIGDDEGGVYQQKSELERIALLAEKIRENKWIEAVVCGVEKNREYWLIEGQHRARISADWIQNNPGHRYRQHRGLINAKKFRTENPVYVYRKRADCSRR